MLGSKCWRPTATAIGGAGKLLRQRLSTQAASNRVDFVPVTLVSGYLGSGKTTLLNSLLGGNLHRDKRIAVIVNEFGDIAIDDQLVAHRESVEGEDIFHTTTGCICCNVRSDLLPVLQSLYAVHAKEPLDALVVETTGLASLNPVIQTFLRGDAAQFTQLSSVVTLVDAMHGPARLEEGTPEFLDQISYADQILLNKVDLVESKAEGRKALDEFSRELRRINPLARFSETALHEGEDSSRAANLELIDDGAYDLQRLRPGIDRVATALDGKHQHGGHGHGHGHDEDHHHHHHHHHHHVHDHSVIAVSLELTGRPLEMGKVEEWLGNLLLTETSRPGPRRQEHAGSDIVRMKGLLRVVAGGNDGESGHAASQILAVQAVHASYQGDFVREDEGESDPNSSSRIVFIGRNIDGDDLAEGLEACCAGEGDDVQVKVLTNRHH